MAIVCPHCDHRINLKAPKPGRYRPRCPKCVKPFALVVPADANAPFDVRTAFPVTAREAIAVGAPDDADSFGFANTNPDLARRPATESVFPEPSPEATEDEGPFMRPHAEVRGFRIERQLGRGGMGTVYLARQLSLDRNVALKVMSKRWACDPTFVARFTREAYAAAQLSHPNIVGIHDIGEVDGARFFSMEYVSGRSLAELLKRSGKIDTETAVGYVLQAARGLKHAHDRGMIHRDVKPDNLLLDDQGLVKVADLGLVKTPAMRPGDDEIGDTQPSGLNTLPHDMTGARIALGTPAYMSPEQCRDAASVDHRADIYSLGCTLYVLVTGRPPFDGTTAMELMTKHAYEPLVPPDQIVSRVPKELSAVITRMMEKNPEDRPQTMGDVIRTLEAWLGVRQAGTFTPQEEQIDRLEGFAHQFNTAPKAVLRNRVLRGSFSVAALAAILFAFFGKLAWSVGLLGMLLNAGLTYFVIDGVARKGAFFTRVRQFVVGLGWGDWGVAGASAVLFGLLLGMLGVFWAWAGFAVVGVGLAFALRYGLDRAIDDQRRPAVEGCEKLLRRLRVQGFAEEDLRQFVAKFSGRYWEEFFEALFGYDAKLEARALLLRGGSAGPREKHAAWREPLIALIERVEKARRESRERRLLAAVEQARLLADGASVAEAERQAADAAEALVRGAEQIREAEAERVRVGTHAAPPVNVGQLAQTPPDDFDFSGPSRRPRQDPFSLLVGVFVGPHVRAVAAAVLLAGCGLWAHQNGLIPGAEVQAQAAEVVESQDSSAVQQNAALDATRSTRPLIVEGLDPQATVWVDSFNVGVAGVLLLLSLFHRGNTMAVFVLLGAAVAVAGARLGVRSVEPLRDYHIALMLGSVLALVGFRTGTR